MALVGAAVITLVVGLRPEPASQSTSVVQSPSVARIRPPTFAGELPAVLSADDAQRYAQAFELQAIGAVTRADKVLARIEDKLILSHVMADRYLRQKRPRYRDLAAWLRTNRGHPDAGRIYRLARQIKPKRTRSPARPRVARGTIGAERFPPAPYASRKNLTRKQRRQVTRLKRIMRNNLKRGFVTKTERMLAWGNVKRLFDRFEFDQARANVAAAWYYQGKDKKAYKLASVSIARSGDRLPISHWTAGLSAWRMKRYEQCARHFITLANAPGISGWIVAGGAYWAARAYKKLGRSDETRAWLKKAADHPQTLYGVLARSRLGMPLAFEAEPAPLDADAIEAIAAVSPGRRALALIEIGQSHRAEQELLGFRGWRLAGLSDSLLSLARHAALPSLGLKLSKRLAERDGEGGKTRHLPISSFPVPPWGADREGKIDRALLFAFMRQESDFNTFARSHVGARGLMQIMPGTARELTRRRIRARDLYDPELSVELGQRYLTQLLSHRAVRGNLLRLIASYNSGPGNVNYWRKKMMKFGNDPLLYIETLPSLETRLFVRRVLTNLWLYRHRFGQSAPSLDAMLKGEFPNYKRLDAAANLRVSLQDAS